MLQCSISLNIGFSDGKARSFFGDVLVRARLDSGGLLSLASSLQKVALAQESVCHKVYEFADAGGIAKVFVGQNPKVILA
jgi:hypothetical protein